jgi:hypothetical protein
MIAPGCGAAGAEAGANPVRLTWTLMGASSGLAGGALDVLAVRDSGICWATGAVVEDGTRLAGAGAEGDAIGILDLGGEDDRPVMRRMKAEKPPLDFGADSRV